MFAAIRRASSPRLYLQAASPEPRRHSDQRNNDTDEAETNHDAIGIELWGSFLCHAVVMRGR